MSTFDLGETEQLAAIACDIFFLEKNTTSRPYDLINMQLHCSVNEKRGVAKIFYVKTNMVIQLFIPKFIVVGELL